MRGRDALDIGEAGGGRVLVQVEQQEVGDGQLVQPVRHRRMLADAIERTAEYEFPAQASVEKRLHSQMIAGAEKLLFGTIPDGERKVTDQALDALFSPHQIGAQNQFHVGSLRSEICVAFRCELRNQLVAGIHASVGDDPDAAVDGKRLALVLGLVGCLQQGVAESGVAVDPGFLASGPRDAMNLVIPASR